MRLFAVAYYIVINMFFSRVYLFAFVLALALCVAAVPTGQKRALKQATIARRQPGSDNQYARCNMF